MGVSNQPALAAFTLGQVLCVLHHDVGHGALLLRSGEELFRSTCSALFSGRLRSGRLPWVCADHIAGETPGLVVVGVVGANE